MFDIHRASLAPFAGALCTAGVEVCLSDRGGWWWYRNITEGASMS
jgi:hypothetical protein